MKKPNAKDFLGKPLQYFNAKAAYGKEMAQEGVETSNKNIAAKKAAYISTNAIGKDPNSVGQQVTSYKRPKHMSHGERQARARGKF